MEVNVVQILAAMNHTTINVSRYCAVVAALIIYTFSCYYTSTAQTNPNFNVQLRMDYAAAERSVALYQDEYINTRSLAELRGNRVAAATTATIDNEQTQLNELARYFDSLWYHQIIQNDIYHLESSRKNVAAIHELLQEMQRRNFSMRVAATVEQIFPSDAAIDVSIPVYVVALGHENVDAYVRRIIWHDNIPQFTGENTGELTIIINLAHAANYGPSVASRYESILNIVAHEVFHAAFSAYKEHSSSWQSFYKHHREPIDALLDLTQNEGIAYYLSFEKRGNVPPERNSIIADAFTRFNNNATELLSEALTSNRANELLRKANLSGASDNYGAIAGMIMAQQIDMHLGRAALIQTLSTDPYDFINKYSDVACFDDLLPKIAKKILEKIK